MGERKKSLTRGIKRGGGGGEGGSEVPEKDVRLTLNSPLIDGESDETNNETHVFWV